MGISSPEVVIQEDIPNQFFKLVGYELCFEFLCVLKCIFIILQILYSLSSTNSILIAANLYGGKIN